MKIMLTSRRTCFLCMLLVMGSSCAEQRYSDALSPEDALKKFQIADGFKIELYAAEPYVFDPVSLEFDEQGNAYVVEMPDYPYEAEPDQGKGRIRILKDTNGDGRVDESTVFAENITEATSILPWKGGLIVTAAPHILYLKDTNGDGKSDTKEVLFSGFFENNSEAQITSLRFGVDNWIYANNRGQDGLVSFSRTPGAPAVPMRGADFRFRLDKNQFELETGPGQFGQTIDDWGNRYFTENSIHIQQAIIPWRYTHRHPYLPSTKAVANITDHEEIMHQETPPPYWRAERTRQRNEMYKEKNMDRVEYAEGRFTGASGGTIYAADAFPEEYYGNIFTSDVSGNLVHRDILTPSEKSPVFIAKRGEKEKSKEFLFSTDSWFRPTNFTVGPDGYLYVLDMYRQHIETPVSIPDELKADMDFLAGSDMGRIYRILPRNAVPSKGAPLNLRNTESHKLVEVLAHPNQWWRLQAQRLLLEREDMSVVPAVKTLFTQSQDPRARLHALYVLEGLNSLNAQLVRQAMEDASPGVRLNGVMLAERFPECLPQVVRKIDDASVRVALQAALSLGEFKSKETAPALARVMEKHGQDPWFQMAVLSSEAGSSIGFIQALSKQNSFFQKSEPWKSTFIENYSYVIGLRNQKEQIRSYLNMLSQPILKQEEAWLAAAVTGLKKGLDKAEGQDPKVKESLQRIASNSPGEAISGLRKLY